MMGYGRRCQVPWVAGAVCVLVFISPSPACPQIQVPPVPGYKCVRDCEPYTPPRIYSPPAPSPAPVRPARPELTPEERQQLEERAKAQAKYEAEVRMREVRYRTLMNSLKTVGTSQNPLTGRPVTLRPKGTRFFFIGGSAEDFGIVDRELQPAVSPAVKSSFEDLRRTVYLLQAAVGSSGTGDARFLAEQASLAMEGAPIRVIVPPAAQTPQLTERDLREFDRLQLSLERSLARFLEMTERRRRLEAQYAELEQKAGKSPDPETQRRLETLKNDLQRVRHEESEAKGNVGMTREDLKKFVELEVRAPR